MKSSLLLILLIFTFTFPKSSTNNEDYVRFISQAYTFYKGSSIIFYYGSDTDKSEKDEIVNIAIRFSRQRIMTSLVTFEEHEKLWYRDQEKGSSQIPILVIFMTTEKSLQKYMHQLQLAKVLLPNYRIHFYLQLFVFMRISRRNEKPLFDFCKNPTGNPFLLRFDSQTLVKCYNETKIQEWYSVTGNETDMYDLATLDNENRLVLRTNLTMYARRGGLRGKRLKTVATKTAISFRRKGPKLGGYIGKILEIIKEALNFTLEFLPDEEVSGIWNETTKTWTGAMRLLSRAQIDLVASDITLNSERLRVFDFSAALLVDETLLYIKKPEDSVRWTEYLKPFSMSVWMSIIMFVFAIPLLLTFMETKIGPLYIFSSLISKNYLIVWGIFCQQTSTEFPKTTNLRMAYCLIWFWSMIIWSAYYASLTSLIHVPNSDVLLQSVDDFLADGSYKLIAIKDTAQYEFFKPNNTSVDVSIKAMGRLMLEKDRLPENIAAGFKMVCEEKVAFYVNYNLKNQVDDIIKCEVYTISTKKLDFLAIAFPKNSEYKEAINYYISKIKNVGLLNNFEQTFLKKFVLAGKLSIQVELTVIAFPLTIVVCGITLGVTIFGLEKGCFHYKNSKKRNKINSSSSNSSPSSDSSDDFHGHQNEIHIEKKALDIKFLRSDYEHRIVITPGDDTVNLKI